MSLSLRSSNPEDRVSFLRDAGISLMRVRRFMEMLQSGFPPCSSECDDMPLCKGGDLSVPMLLAAYGKGIFPWFNEGDPLLWWSPAPRCVLLPERYHLPKRAVRYMKKQQFTFTLDLAFERVITNCARVRDKTWITDDVLKAYCDLFSAGFAHSIECWQAGKLAGGLYGVALGRAFFGESMFHFVPEASRGSLNALISLLRTRGVTILDCQQRTQHIMDQGGVMLEREEFESRLEEALDAYPDSDDALTREYMSLGGRDGWTDPLRDAWPYLPWRTHYHWTEGRWEPDGAVIPQN